MGALNQTCAINWIHTNYILLLIEYIKHNVVKSSKYVIKGSKVYEYKKNGSGNEPKPLKQKDIDKLVMPTIKAVYNITINKENKSIISSLKRR